MKITCKNFTAVLWKAKGSLYSLIDLAETYIDKTKVRTRWNEWLSYEAGLMKDMELRGDRIH